MGASSILAERQTPIPTRESALICSRLPPSKLGRVPGVGDRKEQPPTLDRFRYPRRALRNGGERLSDRRTGTVGRVRSSGLTHQGLGVGDYRDPPIPNPHKPTRVTVSCKWLIADGCPRRKPRALLPGSCPVARTCRGVREAGSRQLAAGSWQQSGRLVKLSRSQMGEARKPGPRPPGVHRRRLRTRYTGLAASTRKPLDRPPCSGGAINWRIASNRAWMPSS